MYLVSPVAFWLLLKSEWDSGAFPPEADSVGIPMSGFLFLWFIGLVFIPLGAIASIFGRRIIRARKNEPFR